jgi:hypothetical protein
MASASHFWSDSEGSSVGISLVLPAGDCGRVEEERASGPAGAAAPSLSIGNNCNEGEEKSHQKVQTNHKRSAEIVRHEAIELCREFGVERIGFLTLTFRDHVTELREAQRRFKSLRTGVIQERYERAIGVWERTEAGRIHFHLVVVCPADIRTGANFAEFDKRVYSSANRALRDEWAFWRETCPRYGFGRHELLPVRKDGEHLGGYLGKYLAKHVKQRSLQDKGARLVRFIGFRPEERKSSLKFQRNTEVSWRWRMRVKEFCRVNGTTCEDMERDFGSKWQHDFEHVILGMPVNEVHPSLSAVNRYQNERSTVHTGQFKVATFKEQQEKNGARVYELKPRDYDGSPSWNIEESPGAGEGTVKVRAGGLVFSLVDRSLAERKFVPHRAIPASVALTEESRNAWAEWVASQDEECQREIAENLEAQEKRRFWRFLRS